MSLSQHLRRLLSLKPKVTDIQYAPTLAESSIQFGDRVRILSDPVTEESDFAGKIGEVWGQTTPRLRVSL
jgi:hypothetical protein